MEEVLVSPILASLAGNLNSLLQQYSEFVEDVSGDLQNLLRSLSSVRVLAEAAESEQLKDRNLTRWLTKLKDVAYVADDMIDEFVYEVLQWKTDESPAREFSFWLSARMDTIRTVSEIMHEIAVEGSVFDLDPGERRFEIGGWSEHGDSVLHELDIYGRENDRENVVGLLIGGQDFFVPVVGLGGIGKTTVARLAYNDERVKRHFQIRMWFYMSENLDVGKLTREIVDCAIGKEHWIRDVYDLERCLREMLGGKRFLIVLDGVSSADQRKWGRLRNLLGCGVDGSRIVLTGRTEAVAPIISTESAYHVAGLSDDDCWSVFSKVAFGVDERPEEYPNLVVIGKEIAKKCRGIPVGARAVGSLLRFTREEHEWLTIKDDEMWNIPEDDGISLALRLCYNHLPLHWKECFAYCAIFPRGYELEKEKLVLLWMANGFISCNRSGTELEDLGDEIFVGLSLKSFFLITEDGKVTKCKLHNAAHDLASSVMGAECMTIDNEEAALCFPESIRHLSISNATSATRTLESLVEAQSMRSFLLLSSFSEYNRTVAFPHYISKFKFLRVLDLRYTDMRTLSIPMGNMKHLRYLDLSYSRIEELPESMASHPNLQTLKLRGCWMLRELPENMNNMVSLRHLDIRQCSSLHFLPQNISQLPRLQLLSTFIVGEEIGCGVEELQKLDLRGEVSIERACNIRGWGNAKEANLSTKQYLCSLEISWGTNANIKMPGTAEEVLEGLEPHPNLKRLEIRYYNGIKFPQWMMEPVLTNLEEISLDCSDSECAILPPLGQLPFLKVLFIYDMDAVKCIGAEFYGTSLPKAFPLLKELTLGRMPNLVEWSGCEGREAFPNLHKLFIDECPKLSTLLSLPLLKDLEIRDGNGAELSSVMNFTSLTSLTLDEFPEIVSLPEGFLRNLACLKDLNLLRFPNLTSLPGDLKCLTSLETLSIYACMGLNSLPDDKTWQGLTSLRFLSIWYCRNMLSLPNALQYITSLRTLDIYGCDKLSSLPTVLQQITTLQDLRICESEALMSTLPEWLPKFTTLHDLCIERSQSLIALPESIRDLKLVRCIRLSALKNLTPLPEGLQHLARLETLIIDGCDKLSSLPEWFGNFSLLHHLSISFCPAIMSLPAALQSLAGLEYLSIRYCPHLERRCKKGTGEDCHKIAHVPQIIIEGEDWG